MFQLSTTYRVSKKTLFPTHKFRSHSREGNASGSSTLLFAFDAILGAVTRSNVKVTSGALPPAAARPSRTTVSPERTLLTFADPVAGRMLIILILSLFICEEDAFCRAAMDTAWQVELLVNAWDFGRMCSAIF